MKLKTKKAPRQQPTSNRDSFNVDEFMAGMNTKYGIGSIFRASEAVGLDIQYIRTGCHRLDFALGGGIPKSRMIEVFGNESAGKSTLLYRTIAEFQRIHPEGLVGVVDFERSFDPKYTALLGVDNERLVIVNPDDGEQGADMLNDLVQAKTDILLGVDSIAAMTPSSTLQKSADEQEMGVHPRLVNKVMARCNARMKRNLVDPDFPTTTVIFTNQEREKIGVMFGDPTTTPGGKGKNFFASVRLRLRSSGSTQNKILVPQETNGVKRDVLVGRVTSFTIIKNKCGGTPFEDGEYRFYIKNYKGYAPFSFDNCEALFEYGRFHDVIKMVQKKGDKGLTYTYNAIATKQQHLFIQALQADPDLAEELYVEVLEAIRSANAGEIQGEIKPTGEESEFEEVES